MPDAGLESNYCRNPDGENSIWCYTTDPARRWEYCDPIHEFVEDLKKEKRPRSQETLTGINDDKQYRGSQSKTRNGNTCMNWNSNYPHMSAYNSFTNPDDGLDSNFCRNPDGEETIWCYTTNPDVRWEFCNEVDENSPEGLWGRKGTQYRGKASTTRFGKTCQAWSEQAPHIHPYLPETYINSGLEENLCRNPAGVGETILCFTTEDDMRWDYCNPIHEEVPTPLPRLRGQEEVYTN
jgi:hypothetical protein